MAVMALGGGLSEKAGLVVQIRKSSGSPDGQGVFIVDLDQLIKEGKSELNIKINAGDVLFVPEAGVFFVDGAVKRPGAYSIKHRTVIQEALVEAGGIESWGVKDRIKLVRMSENGKREILELDLTAPGTSEMVVNDRDILMVDASGVSSYMRGFSVKILGTGFSYWAR